MESRRYRLRQAARRRREGTGKRTDRGHGEMDEVETTRVSMLAVHGHALRSQRRITPVTGKAAG